MNEVKTSKITILSMVFSAVGGIIGFVLAVFTFVPSLSKSTDSMFYPLLKNITPITFGIFAFISFAVSFGILYFGYIKKLKDEVDVQPHIKLSGCGIDNVNKNFDFYGEKSYITRNLDYSKRELLYFDVANILPNKKERSKSLATNVSFWLEILDYESGMPLYKKYVAKWVKPENKSNNEVGIDIHPDQHEKRVGVGFMDNRDGTIWLLDASKTYFYDDGMSPGLDHLSNYGRFVIKATITANNVWDEPPLYFILENTRGDSPGFSEMEDGEDWMERAAFSYGDLWKNLNK